MNAYDAQKKPHFLEAYKKQIDIPVRRLLEIGVQNGGSLRVWHDMFPDAEIVGIDIDPLCKKHERPEDNIKVLIGDQTNADFLDSLGTFDVVIDDGGHTMQQQQFTFHQLFPKMASGSYYIIEDTHTSYWPQFWDYSIKTIDLLKSFVDGIHDYAMGPRSGEEVFLKNTHHVMEVHFYPGTCVIRKL